MKSWLDMNGKFRERLFFEAHEFDQMMDEARTRAGVDSLIPGSGIDVDEVLLKAYSLEADYVNLPAGVLGRTIFDRNGQPRIEVSRDLEEATVSNVLARRRLRTTLAHEFGHVVCHSPLFIEDTATMSLFPEDDAVGQEGILCRETSVGEYDPRRYWGEWWEYQANQCMASLLLPRGIFREQVETAVKSEGVGSFEDAVRGGSGDRVVRSLSFCFDVSNQVVYYRLKGLGCVDNPQSTLCLNV